MPIKEVALPVFGASEPKRLDLARPFGNVAAPPSSQYMPRHAFQSAILPGHCEFLYRSRPDRQLARRISMVGFRSGASCCAAKWSHRLRGVQYDPGPGAAGPWSKIIASPRLIARDHGREANGSVSRVWTCSVITTIILMPPGPLRARRARSHLMPDFGWIPRPSPGLQWRSTADLRRAFHGHRRLRPRDASADRIVMKHRDLLGGSGARR